MYTDIKMNTAYIESTWCPSCGERQATTQIGSSRSWYCVDCGHEWHGPYVSSLGYGAVLFCPVESQAYMEQLRAEQEIYARALQEEEALQHYPMTAVVPPCTQDSIIRSTPL